MFVGNDFPEFGTDLVTALASLDVNEFSHLKVILFIISLLIGAPFIVLFKSLAANLMKLINPNRFKFAENSKRRNLFALAEITHTYLCEMQIIMISCLCFEL